MHKALSDAVAWGNWWVDHIESFGQPAENWLYRLVHEAGAHSEVAYETDDLGEVLTGRDKILCPEMPPRISKVQRAVNRLPNWEEKCFIFWHCSPMKHGKPYTKRELAHILGMSYDNFDRHLRSAKRKVKRSLDRYKNGVILEVGSCV